MITKTDIIVVVLLIAGFAAYYIFCGGGKPINVERAKLEVQDSVIVAMRDFENAMARNHLLKADSLQRILDKKLTAITAIKNKYDSKENHVLSLPADSSLNLFLGAKGDSARNGKH